MRIRILPTIFLSLTLVAVTAHGQGVGASGQIQGKVSDQSGAAVANATVTATDVEKGLKHPAKSDSSGDYVISGLSPTIYDVRIEISGFQTQLQKGVVVNVGQAVTLDFHMKVSQVSETVEVTSEPPVVETTRGSQANTINQMQIQDLPINRRDYLTFTLLAPGVSNSVKIVDSQDFRVVQTPQSGLSLYGSNGRGNSVTVDGGEANDDSGGVRVNLGQDAVQEFQINRSNYGADLGSANGASVNIVSKSGSNHVHGSLFGLFRNQGMDAQDPFSYAPALGVGAVYNPANPDSLGTPVKDALSRQQFGGSVGGPLQKDKTFLFVSFEGLLQSSQNSVPLLNATTIFRPDGSTITGTSTVVNPFNDQLAIINGLSGLGATPVPCLTGQPAVPAATCAGILNNVLTINPATSPLNAFIVNQFEANGGLAPFNEHEYLASVRLDHSFNDHNQAYLSYRYGYDNEANLDALGLTGLSRGNTINTYDHTLQAAWYHSFSSELQNELRGQFSYSTFNAIPTVPGEVGLDIAGSASVGTQIFLPSLSILRRYEAADNATWSKGHHTFKFGVYFLERGDHTESHTFFPGRFVFGNLPGGILSPCLQVPAACGLAATITPAAINSLQSVSLGLPQFYQQGFGSPVYNYPRPFGALYAQDTWQIASNFSFTYGLRYEMDAQYGPLASQLHNAAPRVSFAWDPWKDHKTVVRGGYGIFYSPIYGQIADVVQTLGFVNGFQQIAQVFVPLTGAPGNPALTSAAIFQTLFAQGVVQCTTPTAGNAACITPANLTQFGINVSHTAIQPLSVFFSGQSGYQSPYSQQASLGIEREIAANWTVSVSGVWVHTVKLPVAIDTNDIAGAPMTAATNPFTGQSVTFRNWGAPVCSSTPTVCFANPLTLQNNVYSSAGSAVYTGGIIEVKKRFSDHFSMMASYTYSKAIDTTTDFNSDYGPMDNTNLNAERGLSDFDQRHKIVFSSVIQSPWHHWLLSGFALTPIISYNSGHPFNILADSTDINGDRHYTNDRPLGISRNTGIGPDFFTWDMRLSKDIHINEKVGITLTAESFNLLNRTNYSGVNNEVPTLNGFANISAHPQGIVSFLPGAPLAFTSDFNRRQFQLGGRVTF
jgi:hypothetical protein